MGVYTKCEVKSMANDEKNELIKHTYRNDNEKNTLKRRLSIIEGQVRGIKQMIDDNRYCGDILIQLLAVNKALQSLENIILESHLEKCISNQIKEGNTEVTKEIMELFKKIR